MFKLNNHINRSNSVDLANSKRLLNKSMNNINNTNLTTTNDSTNELKNKLNYSKNDNNIVNNAIKSKTTDLSTHGLIELHKFLKEKQIYTNPNDNYKRRTVVLIRNSKRPSTPLNSSKLRHNNSNNSTSQTDQNQSTVNQNGEFGFHLQAYGVINITTQQTEYICFVNSVQPNSPAQQAGLNNGDVILAIDGICINEFTSLDGIMNHIRGKYELRLVIMCENICKKIQLKQRYNRLKQMINDKKKELERITQKEEDILKKHNVCISTNSDNVSSTHISTNTSSSSANSNNNNNSTNNSSMLSTTSSSIECFVSPNQKCESNVDLIKNSTPNEQMTTSTTSSTSSSSLALTPNDSTRKKIPPIIAAAIVRADNRVNKSKTSPNGTARITVENSFISPLNLPSATSSSASSFTSEADSSPNNNNNSNSLNASKQTSFTSVTRPDLLFLKQTPRMSRSVLSSSMSFLTKLNSNFKATPRHAIQLNNPSLTRVTKLDSMNQLRSSNETNLFKAKSNSLENSLNDQSSDISNRNSDVSDSKITNLVDSLTPASLSSSVTSSSLSSSSSISPHLQLTSSLINKSFSNEIDTGVGVGIGTVTDSTHRIIDKTCDKLELSKYSNDNYVITRL